MLAVTSLGFDPTAMLLGLSVRLETLALAAIVLFVLVLVAIRAGRAGQVPGGDSARRRGSGRLRRDDLLLIAFGAVPGAIVGGRIGYGLVHWDYYSANQAALVDPAGGGLSLTLAVALGTLCAIAVARLLAAPVDRWLGLARGPVLLALGLGKLATMLGGAGQGKFSGSVWATAYTGTGPWESLNADQAALPSQAIEGLLVLAGLVLLVVVVPSLLRFRVKVTSQAIDIGFRGGVHAPGGATGFALGLVFWAVARFIAAFTWRDAHVLGPLNAEQLVLIGFVLAIVAIVTIAATVRRRRRTRAAVAKGTAPAIEAGKTAGAVSTQVVQG